MLPGSVVIGPDGSTVLYHLGEQYASFARKSDDGTKKVLANGREARVHSLQDGAIGEPGLGQRSARADREGDGDGRRR